MLTRNATASAVSMLGASLTLSVHALSAQAPAPSPTTPARPTTSVVGAQTVTNITLVGCLYQEKSVPGRTPNAAEKAGVLEDYILADASMPADATRNTTLATGNMYKVENIADEKLRALVGKRVEVAGQDRSGRRRAGTSGRRTGARQGSGPRRSTCRSSRPSRSRRPAAPAPLRRRRVSLRVWECASC